LQTKSHFIVENRNPKTSVQELARQAGISAAIVSRVLTNSAPVAVFVS